MLDYNINYYPVNNYPYSPNSYISSGTAVSDIWGLYNPYDPNNTEKRGKPLDNSIYLWYVGNSAYGTNACVSLAVSSTLDMEVKTDGINEPTPAALCAYNYGFDGQSLNSDRGFRVDPSIRLAYDITKDDGVGGWGKSCLLCDINPLKWCIYPEMAVYSYNTHTIGTFRTLSNIVSYLNADPTRRVISIRNYLYRGGETRDSAPALWDDDGSTIEETPVLGLLKERPICDNLQTTIGAYIRAGSGYDSTKVYNPFNQANTTYFFRSAGRVEGNARQHDIGFAIQIQGNSIISGHDTVPESNGRCTAFFAHFNDKIQDFDDIKYHWRYCLYDETIDKELPNGHNISSYTSHSMRIMSVLEIDDMKEYATYGEAVKAAVLHEVAFLGFWVADTQAKAASDPLGVTTTGSGIYLPEKIGGVTTGNYFTGSDIKDVPYAGATDTSPFKYVPELSPEEEIGENNTIVNSGTIGSGATYYALTNSEMNELSTWLNTTYEPTDQDTFLQDFKGTDPANYITTVMYYPFDIPLDSGADIPVVVGKLTAGGATGRLLYYKYGDLYNFGSYNVPKRGDWLDYLCKTTVFIPFCGSVDLDPILWAGHTLTVKMAIDWPTGVCTAFLYRDNGMIDSLSGSVGVPLPLSSVANGSYQVAITNLLASHKAAHRSMITGALGIAGGAATAIGGAAGFNPKLAIGGLLAMASGATAIDSNSDKMENIEYNIDHTQPRVTEVSGGSPFINCGTDYRVKLLRTEPLMMSGYNAAVYGHTIGFADCRNVPNLANITGFVQCTNIDTTGLGVPADLVRLLNIACQEGLIV